MTVLIPTCHVCETVFHIEDDWEIGEIIECTACGQEHVWTTSSAWLSGEPRLVEPAKTAAA